MLDCVTEYVADCVAECMLLTKVLVLDLGVPSSQLLPPLVWSGSPVRRDGHNERLARLTGTCVNNNGQVIRPHLQLAVQTYAHLLQSHINL